MYEGLWGEKSASKKGRSEESKEISLVGIKYEHSFLNRLSRARRIFPVHHGHGSILGQHRIATLTLDLGNSSVRKHRRSQANLAFEVTIPKNEWIIRLGHYQNLTFDLGRFLSKSAGSGTGSQGQKQD